MLLSHSGKKATVTLLLGTISWTFPRQARAQDAQPEPEPPPPAQQAQPDQDAAEAPPEPRESETPAEGDASRAPDSDTSPEAEDPNPEGEDPNPASDPVGPPPEEDPPIASDELESTDPSVSEEEVIVVEGAPPDDAVSTEDDAVSTEDEVSEVIVAGTRSSHMAGAVQVIGKEELERTEYDDPHQILRQVPGVFVREEDGTGLRPNIAMRGVNPDRSKKVTLMEDGILFGPAPYSAPAAYYFPLMTRMTQVRVIKGPGAVAFGPQTVAGAIDVITRRIPLQPTLGVDLSYGQYGYRKAHAYAGTSEGRFGFLIEGVHVGNKGFKELPGGANTGAARTEVMVKGSYLVDPTASVSNEFSVKLTYSEEASNETYLGLTEADFDRNPDMRYPASALDRMDNHRTAMAFTHELQSYEDKFEVRTTIYRNDFFRVWRKLNHLGGASASDVLSAPEDPENAAYYGVLAGESDTSGPLDQIYIGPNQRDFVSQGLYSRLRWSPSGKVFHHQIEVGVRLHHDAIERDHREDAFQMAGGELYPVADSSTLILTQNRASTHALAIHVTDAITWRSLTLTPGVRIEGIQSKLEDLQNEESNTRTLAAAMPGLGIYYAATPDWGLLAGAYRGFSPPAPGSAKTVKPEMSINYEAGARLSHKAVRAELIGFFNDYSNLTDVCTFSSGCLNDDLDRQFDAGSADIYGLEASAKSDIKANKVIFPVSLAYTLSIGRFRNSFQSADPIYGNVQVGDEVPYLPRHQLNVMVGFELGCFSAYTMFNYVGAARENAGIEPLSEVLSTDPLMTIDAGVQVAATRRIHVYVNGRNLADYRGIAAHRPFGARPNAPRWVQGGAKIEF